MFFLLGRVVYNLNEVESLAQCSMNEILYLLENCSHNRNLQKMVKWEDQIGVRQCCNPSPSASSYQGLLRGPRVGANPPGHC